MGSKIMAFHGRDPMFKNKLITDLDEVSDERKLNDKENEKGKNVNKNKAPVKPKRDKKFKINNIPATAITRRAKSSDGFRITDKRNVKQLLEIKDDQIELLAEKLTNVIEANKQFGRENDRLVEEQTKLVNEVERQRVKIKEIQERDCEKCQNVQETLKTTQTNIERFSKENSDLRNDVKMMKVLVYRLNIQIERYQDYLRKLKVNDDSIYRIDFESPEKAGTEWDSVNASVLAPLLNAYEEMIHEKTDIVQKFEQDMSDFTGKLKDIVGENEKLQKELDTMRRGTESWVEERTRLQAQVDLYRNKAEVQGKRADLAKEKLVEVLRVYEQKVQSQVLDIERLQEAYARSRGELSTLRSLQQKPETMTESLRECQKLFEELKLHHGKEKQQTLEQLAILTEKLEQKAKEVEVLRGENKDLKSQLEKEKQQLKLLNEKYNGLKQNIQRIRHSKDLLNNRLKAVIEWGKGLEDGKVRMQVIFFCYSVS